MTPAEAEEVKRHFNVVAEQLGGQIRLVAEGVSALDAKMDREIPALREEMRSEFEETRALEPVVRFRARSAHPPA